MIAYVNGVVDIISEDNVVLDVGGIGYNIKISASTAEKLPGAGKQVKLYTYTSVREDAIQLFGFLSRNDLDIFKKCISVSGIGPKGALAILSVLDADSLRFAILTGDAKAISKAPGIGAKTAERLILELAGNRRQRVGGRYGQRSEKGGCGGAGFSGVRTHGGREGGQCRGGD